MEISVVHPIYMAGLCSRVCGIFPLWLEPARDRSLHEDRVCSSGRNRGAFHDIGASAGSEAFSLDLFDARWRGGQNALPYVGVGIFPVQEFSEGVPMLRYNVATPWATMDGDWEAGPLYAGMSATLIQAVKPVGELLAEIDDEAETALRRNVSYLRV